VANPPSPSKTETGARSLIPMDATEGPRSTMNETRNFRWRLWTRPGLVLPVFLAGCLCRGGGTCGTSGKIGSGIADKCATIPAGAIPQPLGTHTNEIISRQVNKAEMDQFVIYLYEWQGDSPNFGPFGTRHIERIAARLPQVSFRVVIEPDCDRGINEARRLTIIAYLEQKGIANASEVVQLGFPQAEGLYGDEAERIYRQMLRPQGNNFNNLNNNFQGVNQGGVPGAFQGGAGIVVR
jgi:hypothetical protein